MKLAALLFLATLTLSPQIKKTEVTRTTTPAEDAKGLSPDVPEMTAVSAQFERIVVMRLKNQADLLAGLEKLIAQEKISNAVILSGIGSLTSTHHHVVSNRTFPSKNVFVENPTASADIVSMNGYVMNGKIHCHYTLADPDKSYGGHVEAGNKVFTFAVVTLGVLPSSLDMKRFDDKNWR
jgi:predicted DNA-binding protein with PD1-like motif